MERGDKAIGQRRRDVKKQKKKDAGSPGTKALQEIGIGYTVRPAGHKG